MMSSLPCSLHRHCTSQCVFGRFHHVESLTPCISVNVFADSAIKIAASELFMTQLPRGTLEDHSCFDHFLGSFLDRLGYRSEAASANGNGDGFVERLLCARYAPLELPDVDISSSISGSPELNHEALEAVLKELADGVQCVRDAATHSGTADEDVDGLIEVVVSHLVELWTVQHVGAHQVESRLKAFCGGA